MPKIISVANQKGGVGKTTSCVNFAVGLSEKGYRVLCVDLDPQSHLSQNLGFAPDGQPTITDLMLSVVQGIPIDPGLAIRKSNECVDYIPSIISLSRAELFLAQAMFRESVLGTILHSPAFAAYDYILIDCLPSLGILLTNALIASNSIIIPVEAAPFALYGVDDLIATCNEIKTHGNPSLTIEGILLTKVERTNIAKDTKAALALRFGALVYDTTISKSVEAPVSQCAIRSLVGTPKSTLGHQYRAAVDEFLLQKGGESA